MISEDSDQTTGQQQGAVSVLVGTRVPRVPKYQEDTQRWVLLEKRGHWDILKRG